MRWPYPDDERDDAEFPDLEDGNANDDDDVDGTTEPCPHCSHTVYDDTEKCPGCGMYLSREVAPYRKPWWLLFGVTLCLIVIIGWVVR